MDEFQSNVKLRDSLVTRFILIAAALLIILELGFAAFQIYADYRNDLSALAEEADRTTVLLSTVTTEAILTADFLFLETLMQQTNNNPHVVYSIIVDTNDNLMTRFLDRSDPIIQSVIEDGEASSTLAAIDTAREDPLVNQVSLPIVLEGETIGRVLLGYSTASVQSQLFNSIINTLVISLVLILGLTIGTFFIFEQLVRRPLQRLGGLAQALASGNLNRRAEILRQDEVGQLSQAFNTMATQLQDSFANLEHRVEARTHDLLVAAEVSSQITTILDVNELLPQVVAQTREGYDLYHASVYLFDETEDELRLSASVGRQGPVLESGSTRFNLADLGLVPKSGRDQIAVIENDVRAAESYYKNPLLPDTQSELSIPMIVGQKLIGVLDLQSVQKDRFADDDVRVLTTLATQIGIAVQNAQSYTEAAEAREAAEKANEVKSQFLANMSHELRTPLNAILNFTAFVSDGVLGEVNERQVTTLQKAVTAGKHLLALINDILDITKIEAGLMDLFIEEVDINEIINSTASIGKGLAKDKSVDIITKIEGTLPATFGDKRRLRQVFLNLISNAVKFTTEGLVTTSAYAQDKTLYITVKDTGIGIAPENHAAVFQAFRQAKHELPETVGTGLGMPISRFFIESHQGRMWFESALGSGTTFYIELPILDKIEADAIAPEIPGYA